MAYDLKMAKHRWNMSSSSN